MPRQTLPKYRVALTACPNLQVVPPTAILLCPFGVNKAHEKAGMFSQFKKYGITMQVNLSLLFRDILRNVSSKNFSVG